MNKPPATQKPRFIANAICPQCKSIDSIQLWLHPEEKITCMHCDYTQYKADLEKPSIPQKVPQEKPIVWTRSRKSKSQ